MTHACIGLITDFGDRDGFTGVLKGVIQGFAPTIPILDIAHHIPPQDIRHGSWVLQQAFDAFPPGAFLVAVVDPHVGSPDQLPLAIYFPDVHKGVVLPNNGLATRILPPTSDRLAHVVALTNPRFYRIPETLPSQSFHGRDIYAPVAAHLANAFITHNLENTLNELGHCLSPTEITHLPLGHPQRPEAMRWQGEIDVIDTYGNLITNIPHAWLPAEGIQLLLTLPNRRISVTSRPFYLADPSSDNTSLVLIPGSHGMLEIALPQGNAATYLSTQPGCPITLSTPMTSSI